MSKKPKMTGADACVAMHTALRKCCDSPITSVAYNLIHMIGDAEIKPRSLDPWLMLGEMMAEQLAKGPGHSVEIVIEFAGKEELLRRWAATNDARRKAGRPDAPTRASNALHALVCTLRCFSRADIEGMTTYLDEEEA
jgi:hypothetical protein